MKITSMVQKIASIAFLITQDLALKSSSKFISIPTKLIRFNYVITEIIEEYLSAIISSNATLKISTTGMIAGKTKIGLEAAG